MCETVAHRAGARCFEDGLEARLAEVPERHGPLAVEAAGRHGAVDEDRDLVADAMARPPRGEGRQAEARPAEFFGLVQVDLFVEAAGLPAIRGVLPIAGPGVARLKESPYARGLRGQAGRAAVPEPEAHREGGPQAMQVEESLDLAPVPLEARQADPAVQRDAQLAQAAGAEEEGGALREAGAVRDQRYGEAAPGRGLQHVAERGVEEGLALDVEVQFLDSALDPPEVDFEVLEAHRGRLPSRFGAEGAGEVAFVRDLQV